MKKVFVTVIISGYLLTHLVAFAQPDGGGDLTFTPQNAPPVVFSHNKHMKERGLKCSACHYRLFQMAQGSYRMGMESITKEEFCGRCHNGQVSFDVQDPKKCSCCHR